MMMKSKIPMAGAACLALAGCATEPMAPQMRMALQSPSKAADCRMVYREAARAQGGAPVTAPGGLAGLVLVGVASGIAKGIAEERRTRELSACYDRVGAAPGERLAVRGPGAASEEADIARIMGSGPAPTMAVAARSYARPDRRGPGGGAGFSSF